MKWWRPLPDALGELCWIEEHDDRDAWLMLPGEAHRRPLCVPYETDKHEGLAIRLALADATRAGMVEFTALYGLLEEIESSDGRIIGSLNAWLQTRENAQQVLALWLRDEPDLAQAPELRATFAPPFQGSVRQ